jgi:hypothetical protein
MLTHQQQQQVALKQKTPARPLLKARTHRQSHLRHRLVLAKVFLEWAKEQGFNPKDRTPPKLLTAFLKNHTAVPLDVLELKRTQMFVKRCVRALLQDGETHTSRVGERIPAGMRRVRMTDRKRRLGKQGRPQKASLVREELYEWFLLLKRSIKGRILPRFVMCKAQNLLEEYQAHCLRHNIRADAPDINHAWLRDWRMEYGISFRKPNRKWTVPRAVLEERLQITWENVYRVRRLAQKLLKYDLTLDNMDQSPFHMNEAGSKETGSLSIRGAGVLVLKEGHAASRERWTACTFCVSDKTRAQEVPPLQVMFKAGGET